MENEGLTVPSAERGRGRRRRGSPTPRVRSFSLAFFRERVIAYPTIMLMKKQSLVLFASIIALACSVQAQPGRMGNPNFSGALTKLFGNNQTFSADLEVQMIVSGQQPMSVPGKIAFDSGKSRFEMNLSDAKGGQMPAGAAEHMKAMGMDRTITISRPDTKFTYTIFPGLSAYAETSLQDPDAAKPASAFKTDTTELGKETVDGHPCVKNKKIVTDDQGKTHEFTVWNATDLKDFPIKIETTEQGHTVTMSYKNIKTAKPDAALFEPPSDYKKYPSPQTLMQQEMMKRMGGMTMPPGHP
jgi:hypothetical protein